MAYANAKRKNIRPSANKVNKKVMHYIQYLEQQIEQLRNDPQTVVGQLVPQMREAVGQNKRLSVLAAALIEEAGGSVTLVKSKLSAFETKVLSIKWELPEGVTDPELAESFTFSYEAITREEADARRPEITVTSTEDEEGETTSVEISEPEATEETEVEAEADAEVESNVVTFPSPTLAEAEVSFAEAMRNKVVAGGLEDDETPMDTEDSE